MKKRTIITFILTFLVACLIFCACQTKSAKLIDEKISFLSQREISLRLANEIYQIDEQIRTLSEKEVASLKNLSTFEHIFSEYKRLEDDAVQEIESKISAIPNLEAIKLASEEEINIALSAYDKATDQVKSRVSNLAILNAAKEKLEAVKAACWVKCTICGGDGIIVCGLCNGKGSRQAPYTAPNGTTWMLSAECKKTSTCYACSGQGGTYTED